MINKKMFKHKNNKLIIKIYKKILNKILLEFKTSKLKNSKQKLNNNLIINNYKNKKVSKKRLKR